MLQVFFATGFRGGVRLTCQMGQRVGGLPPDPSVWILQESGEAGSKVGSLQPSNRPSGGAPNPWNRMGQICEKGCLVRLVGSAGILQCEEGHEGLSVLPHIPAREWSLFGNEGGQVAVGVRRLCFSPREEEEEEHKSQETHEDDRGCEMAAPRAVEFIHGITTIFPKT
jgi:hypothetical protein